MVDTIQAGDSTAVVKTKISEIIDWGLGDSEDIATWGDARAKLNQITDDYELPTISDGDVGAVTRSKINALVGGPSWLVTGFDTLFQIDFGNNRGWKNGSIISPAQIAEKFSRSSPARKRNPDTGNFDLFGPGVLRRHSDGYLSWPVVVQYASNNFDFSALVPGDLGAGGALPDHIGYDNNGGVYTYTVAALTKFGLPFISLRVQGTNSGGGTHFPNIIFAGTANGTAAQGQDWTARVRARMASGSAPAGGGIFFSGIRERNSENLYLNEQSAAIGGSAFNDYAVFKTLSDASVSNVQSTIYMRIPSGATIDATIEVGVWELYKSNTLPQAPVINTGNTPVQRAPDVMVENDTSWLQDEMTFVGEWRDVAQTDVLRRLFELGSDNGANRIGLQLDSAGNVTAYASVDGVYDDGVTIAGKDDSGRHKFALAIKQSTGSYRLSIDGDDALESTGNSIPDASILTRMGIANRSDGEDQLAGVLVDIITLSGYLSDQEIEALSAL